MPTYQWVSPTGHIEPTGNWNNPANAYDGNWNTYADNSTYVGDWTVFIILTLPGNMWIDKIRFKYLRAWYPTYPKKIDVDVYNVNTGAWEDVIEADYDGGVQHTITLPSVYTDRLRIRLENGCGLYGYLYEVDVEQVIPDPDVPTPPNPPETYQTITKETKGKPPEKTTRIRTLHRTTRIAPWVV